MHRRLSMVEKSEASPLSKAALTALVAGSLFIGGMPAAEASINSQARQSWLDIQMQIHFVRLLVVDEIALLFVDEGAFVQMSMNTESFSVLSDNQKVYAQKARTVNPYATEEEQMQQVNTPSWHASCQ